MHSFFVRSLEPCLASVVVFAALASGGCGSSKDLGLVSGRVTLDNQPLPQATVTFSPIREGGGSPSVGVTDADGHYKLTYSRNRRGAEPGEHLVTISTWREADPEAEPPILESAEKVPAKYAAGIPKQVELGRNTHNIELTSGP